MKKTGLASGFVTVTLIMIILLVIVLKVADGTSLKETVSRITKKEQVETKVEFKEIDSITRFGKSYTVFYTDGTYHRGDLKEIAKDMTDATGITFVVLDDSLVRIGDGEAIRVDIVSTTITR